MKNKYVIVLGIALLVSAITGYLFQEKKFYYLSSERKFEVTKLRYEERKSSSSNYAVENKMDFSLVVLSFIAALGSGLILTSISFKKINFVQKVLNFIYWIVERLQPKTKSSVIPASVNSSINNNLKSGHLIKYTILLQRIRKRKHSGQMECYKLLRRILSPIANDSEMLKAFERYIVLNDLAFDISKGLYDNKELPWGYNNKQEVINDFIAIDRYAYKHPELQKALDARKQAMSDIRQQLEENNLISKGIGNIAYYHNQVLKYMDESGHLKKSQSSTCSMNQYINNYCEAEFYVLARSLKQIETNSC